VFYNTGLKRLARDKHSSLLVQFESFLYTNTRLELKGMVVKNTLAYCGKEFLTAVKILSTTAKCYKKIYVRNLRIFVFVPDKLFQPSQMFGGRAKSPS
jgi:hypothetical protein